LRKSESSKISTAKLLTFTPGQTDFRKRSIEELKHDPHNRRQRHIADLAERIAKLTARLKRVEEKPAKQLCLNYELKRRITELEAAAVVRDSHNSSLPPAIESARGQGGQLQQAHEEPAPTFGQATRRAARTSRPHPPTRRAVRPDCGALAGAVPRLWGVARGRLPRQV
jgi:hypothetical protein